MATYRIVLAALTAALTGVTVLPAQTRVQAISQATPSQSVTFKIFLPIQNKTTLTQTINKLHESGSPAYQHWLTKDEFKQQFGPTAATVASIQNALSAYGIKVTSTNAHGLTVQGTVAGVQQAFGVKLYNGRTPSGSNRLISTQPLQVPAALKQVNAQVVAFSSAIRHHTDVQHAAAIPMNRYSSVGPYWFDDLKQAYDFPSVKALDGTGATIAVLMTGDYLDSDMALYFGHEKLAVPNFVRMPVDGGAPFDPVGSLEVSLDLQQTGGMAPGATILDYNIPDLSDSSVLDGLLQIISDNQADIVTMSFGGAEGLYTAAYNGGVDYTAILQLQDEIFAEGNAEGITFVNSSGDNGALGLPPLAYFTVTPQTPPVVVGSFQVGVEEPGDSPHVTAVGGTNLVTSYKAGSLKSTYVSENAFDDPLVPVDPYGVGNLLDGGVWGPGGGISAVFPKPNYQNLVHTGSSMRTTPDVSFHMGGCPIDAVQPCDPIRSADIAVVGGSAYGVVGTSASSPDFAGILALEEQHLGFRLGNVNYLIYALSAGQSFGLGTYYHQGIPGDDGNYLSQSGVPGYNLVVGNGTPIVRNFIFAPNLPAAGNPQSPSNP